MWIIMKPHTHTHTLCSSLSRKGGRPGRECLGLAHVPKNHPLIIQLLNTVIFLFTKIICSLWGHLCMCSSSFLNAYFFALHFSFRPFSFESYGYAPHQKNITLNFAKSGQAPSLPSTKLKLPLFLHLSPFSNKSLSFCK